MTTDDFVSLHGGSTFPHSEELFAAIRSGECALTTSALDGRSSSRSQLLSIYRARASMLRARHFTGLHASTILSDVEALASELERPSEEPCSLWCFTVPPHYIFNVFEAQNSHRILGCIRGVDDRLIDDEIRGRLWGSRNGNI